MVKLWVMHSLRALSPAYSAAVVQNRNSRRCWDSKHLAGPTPAALGQSPTCTTWRKVKLHRADRCAFSAHLAEGDDGRWAFVFLKLHPALWPPPPHLGNHPEAVATGTPAVTTTSHRMEQESWSSQKWDEVWALLWSGCCPFSSPDFLVSTLNLSSVEHSCHREASLHSSLPQPGWRGSKVRKSQWVPRSCVRHDRRSWHLERCRAQAPSPPLTFHPLSLRAPSSPWPSYFSTHSLPSACFKLTGSLLPSGFRETIQTNSLFIPPWV